MKVVLAALGELDAAAGVDEVAKVELSRTSAGQGYHVEAVDAVRQAWIEELMRRAR
ncbi:hypothetical protein [Actinophytocola sp.]|uniref:hypothetical protein n=1 Tax=Actinophytocola sp. TaxID=1872138 RepID=UPI00389A385D